MPYNPESVLLDFLKKTLGWIVSNGGFFNSNRSARLFLDTLFSSGFFGVAFGNIFWCTRFLAFIVRSCPRYSGMHSMRSMHSSIKVHTNCVLRLYVCMGIYTHNNRCNSKYGPPFGRSYKQLFQCCVFLTHVWFSSRFWKYRYTQKQIEVNGMTRFKKEEKCLNR